MKKILLVTIFLLSNVARADFMFDLSTGYLAHSSETDKSATMENHFFIGVGIGGKEQLYIGPNFSLTDDDKMASKTTGIGARLNYYFNSDKTFKIMLAFNPVVGGTIGGADVEGSSFVGGLGYELKVNANLYIGAVLAYHKLMTEYKGTKSEINYNTTMPMINASLRFR